MIDEMERQAESRMKKSIAALKSELARIRTGRAHPSLLDHVTVEYYGARVPLGQVSSITTGDATTLVLNVWEKQGVEAVEKAIVNAGLGLNPAVSGTVVRVPVPPLTEERRKDLVKLVRRHGEAARVSIRNARRDVNQHFKDALKAGKISQDEEKAGEKSVQKLTDRYIVEVEAVLSDKEKALTAV